MMGGALYRQRGLGETALWHGADHSGGATIVPPRWRGRPAIGYGRPDHHARPNRRRCREQRAPRLAATATEPRVKAPCADILRSKTCPPAFPFVHLVLRKNHEQPAHSRRAHPGHARLESANTRCGCVIERACGEHWDAPCRGSEGFGEAQRSRPHRKPARELRRKQADCRPPRDHAQRCLRGCHARKRHDHRSLPANSKPDLCDCANHRRLSWGGVWGGGRGVAAAT